MALTATAQSARPAWDETIVPALRKRLESESRILAKRMSIASVSSADSTQAPSAPSPSRDTLPLRHLPEPRKSSAIPRPSLQSSRTPNDARTDPSSSYTRVNGASRSPSMPRRSRTYSQPPSPNGFANNPLPTPESSRPTSPRTSDVKPTRIPIAARSRTISTSSHSVAHRAESRNGSYHRPYKPPTPEISSQDHRLVKPTEPPQPTTSPMASIRHQPSSIINEPAPFATSSTTTSLRSRTQEPAHADPRPSNDSEERPFEHWYRGDVHRNGGVGELRVAKHMEMLQIANYGHNLRKAARGPSHVSGYLDSTRMRKRADSVSVGIHESFYLDDERTKDVGMVLDEGPLSDLASDHDTETEMFYDAYTGVDTEMEADDTIHSNFSAFSRDRPHAMVSSSRSQTPTNVHPITHSNITPKHATRSPIVDAPLRSSTSSAPGKSSAENVPTLPTLGPHVRTPRATSPTSQLSDQSYPKRRAKSPAASSTASTPKKARTKVKTPPLTSRKDDPRVSIATYPTPEGDVVDAIPTWTQPVQKSGNWDEVVLPVVARKRGLDGQYEQVHGSPRPKTPEAPIRPAPGTFGYDYAKYRQPRISEDIQMGEFGRRPEEAPVPEEDELFPPLTQTPPRPVMQPVIATLEERHLQDPRKIVPKPPESPMPFSRYRMETQVPSINVQRPSIDAVEQRPEVYEDDNAGCCKCVIM